MKAIWKLLWVVAFILVSCRSPGIPDGLTATQPVVMEKSTQIPTPALTHSVTPVPTATPSITPDRTATGPELQKKCITVSSPPDAWKIEGTIVFLDNRGQSIVLRNEHEVRIPEKSGSNHNYDQSVSPSRDFLLYRETEYNPEQTSRLQVVTSEGKVVFRFSDDPYLGLIGIDWLSDEYIRYPVKSKEDDEKLELYALNMQTGEMRALRTSFPDMVDGNLIDWGVDTWSIYFGVIKGVNVLYDPSLSLAAYPKKRDDYPQKGRRIYLVAVYDVKNDVELAALHLSGIGAPQWSPDSQYFSIIGRDPQTFSSDIYIFQSTGNQFAPITNLGKQYPRGLFGTYSWSADSQSIAFWHKEGQEIGPNDYSLMLFELASGKMMDLCIQGNSASPPPGFKSSFNLRGKPIWSPDGMKLLITQFDPDTHNVITLLIDLKNEVAYPIATNLEPVGWMK